MTFLLICFIVALAGHFLIYRFLWNVIEHLNGGRLPRLIKVFSVFILWIVAITLVCYVHWGAEIAKLAFFSSASLAIAIYLMQEILRDGISGILLSLDSPFKLLDKVQIGEHKGQVIDIKWRTTDILTPGNNIVSIPNKAISSFVITNYTSPSSISMLNFSIILSSNHDVNDTKEIIYLSMKQAATFGMVLNEPNPSIEIEDYVYNNDFRLVGIKYMVIFYHDSLLIPSASVLSHAREHLYTMLSELNILTKESNSALNNLKSSNSPSGVSDFLISNPIDTTLPFTNRDVTLIKNSWKHLAGKEKYFSRRFYELLFQQNPSIKDLFRTKFEDQEKKLVSMLNFIVLRLSDLQELTLSLQKLGLRHKLYKVKPEHFAMVATALLGAFSEFLGEEFTPDVKEAWIKVYGFIATKMQEV